MTNPRRSADRPRSERSRSDRPGSEERAAAALTGSGPSQLGVDASMRGRDVSRPRPEHMASAEELVQVSYRPRTHPRPPLPSPHSGSGQSGGPQSGGPQSGTGGASPEAS